ncbi:DUF6227 family protein [Streptomyces hainanensis]|uniref:Uncharacterized protein n=1 Tax=Streptomyces hainanensis TaxID=402648 RepID=A0A4V2Y4B6_9ACTN|nr:DUF6227 family protein [Streptomyces hainanensis]TDC79775.1 hypothetical protein E1283_02005 [Streptomyces hainanensis]
MTDRPEALPEREAPSVAELERMFMGGAWPGTGFGAARPAALGVRIPGQRAYPGADSRDHARRLLRRAVNEDRPGDEVVDLVTGARGYDIERLPELYPRPDDGRWCALYEHAFLMADDTELCLYELEHDHTPDRRLVCEVYPDEITAGLAARRWEPPVT